MKRKTIYWIEGKVLVLDFLSCNLDFEGKPACVTQGDQGDVEYKYKRCSIWRMLGLIKCEAEAPQKL